MGMEGFQFVLSGNVTSLHSSSGALPCLFIFLLNVDLKYFLVILSMYCNSQLPGISALGTAGFSRPLPLFCILVFGASQAVTAMSHDSHMVGFPLLPSIYTPALPSAATLKVTK